MAKVLRAKKSKAGRRPAPSVLRQQASAADWPVIALATLGMLITGYLFIVASSGSAPALCAAGSGCDVIQQSRWSMLLGLPIALWGFGLYALIALFAFSLPPQLRRWKRLWSLALIGVAISVYLTVVGIVSLDAVCGWCLASLATISAILATVTLRRPASAPGMPWSRWARNSAIAVFAVVGVLHLPHSGLLERAEDPQLRALAEHLQATGARYYGAYWCPECQNQHRLFGASADRLPYVECSPEGRGGVVDFACVSNGINRYPTWIIQGRRYEQVLGPEALARYSGFRWEASADR